jgi:hypothetical protein
MVAGLNSIFISIASFRDPDCANTISNLLAMANQPDRLAFGVCNQLVRDQDQDCVLRPNLAPMLRIDEVDASLSRGACWARSRIQRLWQGEDYYFQIDSHMRFVEGWDEILTGMLNTCPSRKAVLSTYPLTFVPPDTYGKPEIVRLTPKWFDENGILTCYSNVTNISNAPDVPQENHFVAAGLLFSRSSIIEEIPYDPNLYHVGEEISLAVRLWTHAWDIYTPNRVIAYHDYGKRETRSKHWKNDCNWQALDASSKARVRLLLGIDQSDSLTGVCPDLEPYALGKERTLAEYENNAGVRFQLRTIGNRISIPPGLCANSKDQQEIRRKHFVRLHEVESRHDSRPSAEAVAIQHALTSWLESVLLRYSVSTACNLGCGADRYFRDIVQRLDRYVGYDIVPVIVDQNRLTENHSDKIEYFVSDILSIEPDQHFDLIILTQVLEYLPLDAAVLALGSIATKLGEHVVLTYYEEGRNRWISYGDSYEVCVTQPPFSLPEPIEKLSLTRTLSAGLWKADQFTQLATVNC